MYGILYLVLGLILFIIFLFVMRAVGAWMFKIDEVIKNQQIIIDELKNQNENNRISGQ